MVEATEQRESILPPTADLANLACCPLAEDEGLEATATSCPLADPAFIFLSVFLGLLDEALSEDLNQDRNMEEIPDLEADLVRRFRRGKRPVLGASAAFRDPLVPRSSMPLSSKQAYLFHTGCTMHIRWTLTPRGPGFYILNVVSGCGEEVKV